jgi:hypothetical protein
MDRNARNKGVVDISENALLVNLTIPTVQSVITMRSASSRVAQEECAEQGAVRVVAAKLPVARAAKVQAQLDVMRAEHVRLTLPFIGTFRVLVATSYLKYLETVQAINEDIARVTREEFGNREEVLKDIRAQLGDLPFSENDVPTLEKLLERVHIKPFLMPVSDAFTSRALGSMTGDGGDQAKLAMDTHRAIGSVIGDSMCDVLEEVESAVERVITSLVKYDEPKPEFDANGKKTRRSGFHATMVNNLLDLGRRLPLLDLSTDKLLTSLAPSLFTLGRYTTDELKDDYAKRADILREAKFLLSSVRGETPTEEFHDGSEDIFGGLL